MSAKSKTPKPSKYTLHTAQVLARDGFSPDAVEQKTGLPASTVKTVFLALPDRARQWGVKA